MSSLNHVVQIGNIVRDPESKFTTSGTLIVNTAIAVTRFTKNADGDYDVDFHNLLAFGKTAEYISSYIKKGNRVAIEGRLQNNTWTDKETGKKRSNTEIVVTNVQNLTARPKDDEASESVAPSKPSVSISDHGDDESDEVDPFAEEG